MRFANKKIKKQQIMMTRFGSSCIVFVSMWRAAMNHYSSTTVIYVIGALLWLLWTIMDNYKISHLLWQNSVFADAGSQHKSNYMLSVGSSDDGAAMMEHLSNVLCQQFSATPGIPTSDYTWATAAHNSFHDCQEHADVDGFCVCKSIQEILVLICQHKCQLHHAYLLFTLIHPGCCSNSFHLAPTKTAVHNTSTSLSHLVIFHSSAAPPSCQQINAH